jgi:hypothetical protein
MTQPPTPPPATRSAGTAAPVAPAAPAGDVAVPANYAQYRALRIRERDVRRQIETAGDERDELAASISPSEDTPAPPPAVTAGVEARIALIDARILRLEGERDAIDRALAQAPAGLVAQNEAIGETTAAVIDARNEGVGVGLTAGIPSGVVLLLLWQAWRARRRARRAGPPIEPTRAPGELVAAVEAMAIEVERIGEGQRFITQLLADERARAGIARGDGRPI